ncbi:MAG: hypothetical protein GOU97_03130 [Nanoarchaeota archaeon]|nr:hypothetical protein [Nanoarchaeota archaeon]
MPYDPRPTSKGGNRGLNEIFSRKSPEGKFRVIGVDSFDGTDWVAGDFPTLEEAIEVADEKGGKMTKMYVYNDKGKSLYNAGTF